MAECLLAKNVMLTVAGHTPYKAIYGRDPPMLAECEPTSQTQLDDTAGGIPGYSRHTMRLREVVMQSMTQVSAIYVCACLRESSNIELLRTSAAFSEYCLGSWHRRSIITWQ